MIAGGQFFNLFNLGKTEAAMKDLRTKELKNGRLAMLAGMNMRYLLWCCGTFKNYTYQHGQKCLQSTHWPILCAVFGYGAQAVITAEGPFKNLRDHLADPTGHNILTNFGHPAL